MSLIQDLNVGLNVRQVKQVAELTY